MKRIFLEIVLLLGILVVCVSCSGADTSASQTQPKQATQTKQTAQAERSLQTEDEIISSVEQLVKTVYECKDIGRTKSDLTVSLDLLAGDISDYILGKINVNKYFTQLTGRCKNNYKLKTELLDKEFTSDNKLKLRFSAEASYNYENCGFDSGYSEVAEILYDLSKGKVVDFYADHNYYDMAIRGEKRSKDVDDGKPYKAPDDFSAKQKKLLDDICTQNNKNEMAMSMFR